jgi:hypothetical protein
MVLCPFVFLYTKPDIPPLKLQPTEVASTHWVPLRVLLSPSARTFEYVDTAQRYSRQGSFFIRNFMHLVLGKMRFSAVRLIPSESLYCSSTEEFFPSESDHKAAKFPLTKLYEWYLGDHSGSSDKTRPLLLWGLTLGILADFLEQLPPHSAVKLWSYPTFTSWDAQFIIYMLTARLKKRNQLRLLDGNQTAFDGQTEAVAPFNASVSDGIKRNSSNNISRSYAVGIMLDGYYDKLRLGAQIAAATRVLGSWAIIFYIIRRFKR